MCWELQLANSHASARASSALVCLTLGFCKPRREYRIPIKAALNGTAGAHTLKVVISPAAVVANQKAADYKYNVPGLTQPGNIFCCFFHIGVCCLCSDLLQSVIHGLLLAWAVLLSETFSQGLSVRVVIELPSYQASPGCPSCTMCRWSVLLQLHPQACI